MSRMEKTPEARPIPAPAPVPVPKRPAPAWFKFCCACSCAVLAVVGAFLFWILWLVAATGMTSVPLLTALAYRQPEPVREVKAEKGVLLPVDPEALKQIQSFNVPESGELSEEQMAALEEQFGTLFNEKALQDFFNQLGTLGGGITSRSFSVMLSEGVMTGMLQQSTSVAKDPENTKTGKGELFDVSRAQIAVSSEKGLEIFLPFKNNSQRSAARAYVLPSATVDGKIDLELTEVWIGNLRLPDWLIQPVSDELLRKGVASISPELAKYVILKTLDVRDGGVRLEGTFTDVYRSL